MCMESVAVRFAAIDLCLFIVFLQYNVPCVSDEEPFCATGNIQGT